jgi:hypothetical protein
MHDPGFILHVQDGQHFFYQANSGQPFGHRNGPYPDEGAATQAAEALLRVIGRHRMGRRLRFGGGGFRRAQAS